MRKIIKGWKNKEFVWRHLTTLRVKEGLWYYMAYKINRYLGAAVIRLPENITVQTVDGIYYVKTSSDMLFSVHPFHEFPLRKWFDSVSKVDEKRVVFLDIGAFVGEYTVRVGNALRLLKKNFSIYSFEPNQESYGYLVRNIEENKLQDMVSAYSVGLSETPGMLYFYKNHSKSRVIETTSNDVVQVLTLDAILEHFEYGETFVLMKVDVEGHELELLKGSENVLENIERGLLVIEILPDQPEKKQIFAKLHSLGFRIKYEGDHDFIFEKNQRLTNVSND